MSTSQTKSRYFVLLGAFISTKAHHRQKKSDTIPSKVAILQREPPLTTSESEQPATKSRKRKRKAKSITGVTTKQAGVSSSEASPTPQQPPTTANATKQRDVHAEFESNYLKQVTAEFANDIEKLRQAPDFKDSFVPVLIKALKQGADIFSDSEKRLVLGLGDGST